MTPKDFALPNAGMNRSLSISKVGNSCVYENRNIRILAHENDTMLTVTNERGTKSISLGTHILGDLVGWNVLNNHIILFTTYAREAPLTNIDRIYRIDYINGEFQLAADDGIIYSGNLGFSTEHPIESVVCYESEEIQKIYWVDGIHVLRFMNFMADGTERSLWDDTYFDSNRIIHTSANAQIKKDNSGNTRPNGTIQYLLTYYNLHGQESAVAWISDIVYLSPLNVGGSADGYNSNRITISFSSLDTRYTNYRVYCIFRSSLDGTVTSRIIEDNKLNATSVVVIDDYANQEEFDAASLLFLGSQEVVPGTLTHKDGTLFLGDLTREGMEELYNELSSITSQYRLQNGDSSIISYTYSDGTNAKNIPYEDDKNYYSYENQLKYSSSEITSFKGGEKYRFALVFHRKNGTSTKAFWIGDKENSLYPVIDTEHNSIRRVIAKCSLPSTLLSNSTLQKYEVTSVQLMIAEATYSDRSVKAQGIVNPTMFNVFSRYNKQIYSMPSWISRPRGSRFACRHFEPVHNSTSSTGEIECNYWTNPSSVPTPYYTLSSDDIDATVVDELDGKSTYEALMIVFSVKLDGNTYYCDVYVVKGYSDNSLSTTHHTLLRYRFDPNELDTSQWISGEETSFGKLQWSTVLRGDENVHFEILKFKQSITEKRTKTDSDRRSLYAKVTEFLRTSVGIDESFLPGENAFTTVLCQTALEHKGSTVFMNGRVPDSIDRTTDVIDTSTARVHVFNYGGNQTIDNAKLDSRWYPTTVGMAGDSTGTKTTLESQKAAASDYEASYYKRHLMFVDENTVTLNSPEIQYEAVNLDNLDGMKFRIVGVAKVSGNITDYVVDASHGKMPGENLVKTVFSTTSGAPEHDGLTAFPLWQEYGLQMKDDKDPNASDESKDSSYYNMVESPVVYWLHMWNHSGIISMYNDEDNSDYSTLYDKTFANLRFCRNTIYNPIGASQKSYTIGTGAMRQFNYTNSQLLALNVLGVQRYYNGIIQASLSMPKTHTYPILYSGSFPEGNIAESNSYYLRSASPVQLTFSSSPHVVLSLPYANDGMKILPRFSFEKAYSDDNVTRCLPWDFEKYTIPFAPLFTGKTCTLRSNADGTVSYIVLIAPYGEWYSEFQAFVRHFGTVPVYAWFKENDGHKFVAPVNSYVLENIHQSGGSTVADLVFTGHIYFDYYTSDGTVQIPVFQYTYDDVDTTPSYMNLTMSSGTTSSAGTYSPKTFGISQDVFEIKTNPSGYSSDVTSVLSLEDAIHEKDKYLFIGEIYYDFSGNDTRYGGITDEAVKNNRFIPAGRKYELQASNFNIYGTEGDTYFQRWDCLKTTPIEGSKDGVIDITSFMVETHINIDGRTDKQRGLTQLASTNLDTFGQINPVYTQADNYFTKRSYDKENDEKSYRTAITWTLEKANGADIDEWSHITLASSLVLDGDKGACNALRRVSNTIVAFQDTAISEILFNSRTQLSTTSGVPVEIANSGKVDGKRVLTDKYGCRNKWSIANGKNAIYFVDSINKAFCSFNGGSIENISAKLGFDVWFKVRNDLEVWKPTVPFNTFVSFFDKVNSDVYILKTGTDNEAPCLVYNETLGTFTSFFDYRNVQMMTNVLDRFVSYHVDNGFGDLWLQNEGLFCNFYGVQYDYWMQYRVTPDPYGDKIWTNIEYRADFYEVLNNSGDLLNKQSTQIDGGVYENDDEQLVYGKYLHNETFDDVKIWNEYQQTDNFGSSGIAQALKKFRIWRFVIPRALRTDTNKYGLDRIRNPWINILLKKTMNVSKAKNLMQMHDMIVRYYE